MSGEYYKTQESVEEYIRLAKEVDGSELIKRLKEFLPIQSSILELGSGPGSDWNILNRDFDVTGSDYSMDFLDRLVANYPSGKFLELDAVTLDTELKFDCIYSNKVMHHLKHDELKASIRRQIEVLKSNGIICHSFWKGEGSEMFKGLFVNYHTEETLKDIFEKAFEILVLEEYAEFEKGDSLLLIARKR